MLDKWANNPINKTLTTVPILDILNKHHAQSQVTVVGSLSIANSCWRMSKWKGCPSEVHTHTHTHQQYQHTLTCPIPNGKHLAVLPIITKNWSFLINKYSSISRKVELGQLARCATLGYEEDDNIFHQHKHCRHNRIPSSSQLFLSNLIRLLMNSINSIHNVGIPCTCLPSQSPHQCL